MTDVSTPERRESVAPSIAAALVPCRSSHAYHWYESAAGCSGVVMAEMDSTSSSPTLILADSTVLLTMTGLPSSTSSQSRQGVPSIA